MTISYSGNFACLFSRWKGGILKAIWKELAVYLFLFFIIRIILQFAIPEDQYDNFLRTVDLFGSFTKRVPLAFLVGCFVSAVLIRWQQIVKNLSWPDNIMMLVNANFQGNLKEEKLKKHAIARYLSLCQVLVFRDISKKVRKRFPRIIEVANSGLMTFEEYQAYEEFRCINIRWQLPLQWLINGILVPMSGKTPGKINAGAIVQIIKEINVFRRSMHKLYQLNWFCVPLLFAQTISAVVYGYFLLCLIGHQYPGKQEDTVVPLLTILQFVFYVGWLKVGQKLTRPFGEDDDDLELNFILDRNAQIGMYWSDHVTEKLPRLEEDRFFGWKESVQLPYTKLSTLRAQDHQPKMHALIELKNRRGIELWERKTTELPVLPSDAADSILLLSTKRTSIYF